MNDECPDDDNLLEDFPRRNSTKNATAPPPNTVLHDEDDINKGGAAHASSSKSEHSCPSRPKPSRRSSWSQNMSFLEDVRRNSALSKVLNRNNSAKSLSSGSEDEDGNANNNNEGNNGDSRRRFNVPPIMRNRRRGSKRAVMKEIASAVEKEQSSEILSEGDDAGDDHFSKHKSKPEITSFRRPASQDDDDDEDEGYDFVPSMTSSSSPPVSRDDRTGSNFGVVEKLPPTTTAKTLGETLSRETSKTSSTSRRTAWHNDTTKTSAGSRTQGSFRQPTRGGSPLVDFPRTRSASSVPPRPSDNPKTNSISGDEIDHNRDHTSTSAPSSSVRSLPESLHFNNNMTNNNDASEEDPHLDELHPPNEPGRSGNNSNTAKKSRKKPTVSFTADSPYFSAYVEKEMNSLSLLTETLRDIASKARDFRQTGAAMSEATKKLSAACNLDYFEVTAGVVLSEEEIKARKEVTVEKRESVGEEMGSVLGVLSAVLDEMAVAQMSMCQSLEASLSLSLEAFAGIELQEATRLRTEAEMMTENSETAFARYLHGRHSERTQAEDHLQNVATASWNKLSDQVGNTISGSIKGWGRGGSAGNNSSDTSKADGKKGDSKDTTVAQTAAASLIQNLEQIRLLQANSELKRFQLLRRLDSLKTRRNFDLGESALASLHGIRAYFHHCSDLVQGLSPRMQQFQSQQASCREKHDAQQAPWEDREKGLSSAISEVARAASEAGVMADAIQRGQAMGSVSANGGEQVSLASIEEEVKLWDLPRLLAESSLYQRDPTHGVMVEGWLYKKSTSRISIHSWNKRWFTLDKSGVYYLRGGLLGDSSVVGTDSSMERVRVCDILLCTVREVMEKNKQGNNAGCNRFVFEIITPNSRPYTLQACGPIEYRRWVDGVRHCIERQLTRGTSLNSRDLRRNPDTGVSTNSKSYNDPPTSTDSPTKNRKSSNRRRSPSKFKNDTLEKPVTDKNAISSNSSKLRYEEEDDDVSSLMSCGTSFFGENAHRLDMRTLLKTNHTCADCDAPNPDWASLNLGVLLCIECSGVHRSLGVHVSKVRSIRLDDISGPEIRLLLAVGNEFANSIWESGMGSQKGWTKPTQTDSRKNKEEWIKSKYVWRGFLEYKPEDGREWEHREKKFSVDLFEASKKGDVYGVAEAIAKGGNVEWKNHKESGKTALHVCAMSESSPEANNSERKTSVLSCVTEDGVEVDDLSSVGGKEKCHIIECAELLLQNGAKMDSLDYDGHNPLDSAVFSNAPLKMIEYLTGKMPR